MSPSEGKPVGQNIGAIWVEARATQAKVAAAVEAFWVARGARVSKEDPLAFRPLSLAETGQLGYAILPAEKGWIGVFDSERYTACTQLAMHLAKELDVGVVRYEISDAANATSVVAYGSAAQAPRGRANAAAYVEITFARPYLYFDCIREESKSLLRKMKLVALADITAKVGVGKYTGASAQEVNKSNSVAKAKRVLLSGDAAKIETLVAGSSRGDIVELLEANATRWLGDDGPLEAIVLIDVLQQQHVAVPAWLIAKVGGWAAQHDRPRYLSIKANLPDNNAKLPGLLGGWAATYARRGRDGAAKGLVELALTRSDIDADAACNLLWAAMSDNHKGPRDEPLLRRAIEAWAALGEKNPSVHVNAACGWGELGEDALASEQLVLALERGFADRTMLRTEPSLAGARRDAKVRALLDLPRS